MCIKTGRKTSFSFIKLVAANSQVRHYAINGRDIMQPQKPAKMPKVLCDEKYPFVVRQILAGIFILVKSNQPPLLTQSFKNGFGMTSSSECAIHINTARNNR